MKRVAVLLVLSACSGGDDDDDKFDPGPGVLTLEGYPTLTNQMMLAVDGRKASGAGVLVDGDLTVVQDDTTMFSVTLTLTEGPNRFKLEPVAASLAMGDAVTVEVELDSLAPGLREVVPIDGATDVAQNAAVVATFNETLDCAAIPSDTLTLAVTGGAAVTGAMSCDDRVLTFQPTASLAAMTEHSVNIDPDVKDVAGNVQRVPAAWSFTTGG